jgi:hypothetical protein
VSTTGSDSNACTQAAPCKTLQRGYLVAKRGGTVEVAGGSYGTQDPLLSYDASKDSGSGVVTIQPAAGAAVVFGGVSLRGVRHVRITGTGGSWTFSSGIFIVGQNTSSGAAGDDITLDHMRIPFLYSSLRGLPPESNVTIDSSDLGGVDGCSREDIMQLGNTSGWKITNNTIHDLTRVGCNSHSDGIQFMGPDSGALVQGNTFRNLQSDAVFVKPDFGSQSNMRVMNNRVDDPLAAYPYSIEFDSTGTGSTVGGEIGSNCILSAFGSNHIIVNGQTIDSGNMTMAGVFVHDNRFGGC